MSKIVARLCDQIRRWQQTRFWRPLLTLLILAPAVALIAVNTYRNWQVLRELSWRPQWALWGGALAAYVAAVLSVLWAWHDLLGRLARFQNRLANARIYLLSNLPRRLPGPFWYMLGRVHLYQAEGVGSADVLAATALEIMLLTITGGATYLLMQPFWPARQTWHLLLALGVLAVALVALRPAFFNRAAGYLLRKLGSTATVRITYRALVRPGLAYLCGWVLTGISLYLVAHSLYPLPWAALPAVIGMWAASGTVGLLAAIFLWGFGAREVALGLLLAALMPQPVALAVSILFWFLLTLVDVLWAGLVAWPGRGNRRALPSSTGDEGGGRNASQGRE